MKTEYRICALIPVYNHGATTPAVVAELEKQNLDTILVDDGSRKETRIILEELIRTNPHCVLVQLNENSGKGGAVIAGLKRAKERGFSHVLQVDADGQHGLGTIRGFLSDSIAHYGALIAGAPVYDESAPRSRMVGRKITNFWVSLETLSGNITDAMCGYRIYPVDITLSALRALYIDKRMGFDIEVLVRLHWMGVPLRFRPVTVDYPENGISNFRMVRDNFAISLVHTKLFFGMILRLPFLFIRRLFQGRSNG